MCQDFGPLFASQLDAIRSYEDNYFGGKIKSRSIQKFDTQVGPTCGLVAVRVAASALKLESIPTVNELLAFCQKHKYTKNGECFSVDWLRKTILNFVRNVNVEICNFPSTGQLIETIANDGVYLIPYDSDKNFGPCNNNGHNAHWFAATGFFILDRNANEIVEAIKIDCEIDESLVHLIGYQGKSRNAGLWSYKEMRDSNGQLNEHSPKLKDDSILPEGGITAGLKGRVLRVYKSIE